MPGNQYQPPDPAPQEIAALNEAPANPEWPDTIGAVVMDPEYRRALGQGMARYAEYVLALQEEAQAYRRALDASPEDLAQAQIIPENSPHGRTLERAHRWWADLERSMAERRRLENPGPRIPEILTDRATADQIHADYMRRMAAHRDYLEDARRQRELADLRRELLQATPAPPVFEMGDVPEPNYRCEIIPKGFVIPFTRPPYLVEGCKVARDIDDPSKCWCWNGEWHDRFEIPQEVYAQAVLDTLEMRREEVPPLPPPIDYQRRPAVDGQWQFIPIPNSENSAPVLPDEWLHGFDLGPVVIDEVVPPPPGVALPPEVIYHHGTPVFEVHPPSAIETFIYDPESSAPENPEPPTQ